MASLVLAGDTSGSITVSAPAVAGSNTITLPATTGTAALTSDVIGVNQTWQDVSASRTAGVTYTNSTGKPIMVATRSLATSADFSITVSGVVTALCSSSTGTRIFLSTIVPNGATYVVSSYQAGFWSELR